MIRGARTLDSVRTPAVALLLLLGAVAVRAEDKKRDPRVDLDVVVPVPPVEHERLYFFGKHDPHPVPGTVTINGAPYECDLDRLRFRDRDRFVAHLRSAHHMPADRIPDTLVVIDGRVHFVGE